MNKRVQAALAVMLASILVLSVGPSHFLAGLAAAILPVPFYVMLALWLDRNEPEPRNLLARAFIWGMLVASLVSIVMNAAAVAYVQLTLGLSAVVGERVGTLLASPVFEEITKGTALFLLFRRQRDEFDDVVDGIVYAAMVGLGFAATENILYYGNAAAHGRLAAVFAMRGLASPFAHPLFTAMTGIGFGLARDAKTRRSAFLRVAAGLGAAITLHALWNAAGSAHMFMQAYALIMLPTFIGVLVLLRSSLQHERDIVQRRIATELPAALASEVRVLCANIGAAGWWRRHFGTAATRQEAQCLHTARRAAVELSFACWHDECAGQPDGQRASRLRTSFEAALVEWRAVCMMAGKGTTSAADN